MIQSARLVDGGSGGPGEGLHKFQGEHLTFWLKRYPSIQLGIGKFLTLDIDPSLGDLRTCQLGNLGSTSTLEHTEIRDANMTFRCPESGPALCVDRAAAPTGPTACQGLQLHLEVSARGRSDFSWFSCGEPNAIKYCGNPTHFIPVKLGMVDGGLPYYEVPGHTSPLNQQEPG